MLTALTREVQEETGIAVAAWSRLCWTTEVLFVDLEMHLEVEVHLAADFGGAIEIDDPDGIVVEAHFLDNATIDRHLETSPPWIADPVRDWMSGAWSESRHFEYRALGRSPAEMTSERVVR